MMNRGSMWRGVAGGLLVAGTMMASACATDGGDEEEIGGADPIAEVELGDGGRVTFYEPMPGAIMIDQEVRVGEKQVPTTDRTAVEIFESLAPGEPVPPALLAAQARADEARASRPHADLPDAVIDTSGAAISDASFISNYCLGSWDIIKCFPLHKDYSVSYWQGDVDEAYWVTCANAGVVTMQTQIDDDSWTSWDISAGYCGIRHWVSGWLNQVVRVKVVNVGSNDDYNLSMRYRH
jgi:hypothetical protein